MPRLLIWSSLAMALALAGCATAPADSDNIRITQDGKLCVEADAQPDAVIRACNRALGHPSLSDDATAMVLVRRGFALLEKNQLAAARRDFEFSSKLAPSQVDGHIGLAMSNIRERKLDAAILDTDRAIAVKPNSVRALLLRSAVYRDSGDIGKARGDVDRAMLLEPRNPAALSARGTLRRMVGDLDAAVSDLDLALSYDANRSDALESRGHIRFQRGDFRGAADDFGRARDPRQPDVDRALWLIVALMRAGDGAAPENAKEQKLPKATVTDARAAILGLALGQMNIAELEASTKDKDPRIAREQECTVMFFAAEFRLQEGDREFARKLLQRAIDTDARNMAAHAAAIAELQRIDSLPARPRTSRPAAPAYGRAI